MTTIGRLGVGLGVDIGGRGRYSGVYSPHRGASGSLEAEE